jgi:plastocyanin
MMRYLLLSVLVVCVIGVMIPNAFAAVHEIEAILGSSAHECDPAWGAGWSCYQDENKDLGGSQYTSIAIADSVKFVNNDNAAHTFTSGYPVCAIGTASCPDAKFVPNGIWDSGLVMPGSSFTVVFNIDDPVHNVVPNNSSPPMPLNLNGVPVYPYFCEVHPWMYGQIEVNQLEGFYGQPDSEYKTGVLSEAEPTQTSVGCGAGTVLVNGVCQPVPTQSKTSFMPIEPLYIIIAVVAMGGVIGAIAVAKRGSKTPKPAQQKPAKKGKTSSACSNCGNTLKPTSKFCAKCGIRRF